MGAKGSVEAAKMNSDNWGPFEVCLQPKKPSRWTLSTKPLPLSHKTTQNEHPISADQNQSRNATLKGQ